MLLLALISLVTSFFGSLAAFVFVLHYDLNGLLEQKLHERVVRKQRKFDPGLDKDEKVR